MRIAITGASGIIGRGLVERLSERVDQVVTLVRRAASQYEIEWDPAARKIDPAKLEGFDAVVHLSGANIAGGRFTEARKKELKDSRVDSTRFLSETLAQLKSKPRVLVCASAIGFYGDRGDERLDERSAPGKNFLADICTSWEAAADPARAAAIRVCHLRVGMVLTLRGGPLAELKLPFSLGVGGRIGNGKQGMSWIDYEDILGLFELCLDRAELSGPINGTAPNPVPNAEFVKTLGKVLRRPTIFPLPAVAVRAIFGEMGRELLLDGNYVLPRVAEQAGFVFRQPDLEGSMRAQLTAGTATPHA